MGFQHPEQEKHKLDGMARAARSPKTPDHLRGHLARRVGDTTMRVDNLRKPGSKVPKQQVMKSTLAGDEREQPPMDTQPFETSGSDISPMGEKMGATTKQPAPAGTRPMNVTASIPKAKAPGIGGVSTANTQPPRAPGLNQNLGSLSHPNSSRRVPRVASVVTRGQRGPGIQKTATAQKTRNMRGPGANPNFYGDF
jgi:hypothetical protein